MKECPGGKETAGVFLSSLGQVDNFQTFRWLEAVSHTVQYQAEILPFLQSVPQV